MEYIINIVIKVLNSILSVIPDGYLYIKKRFLRRKRRIVRLHKPLRVIAHVYPILKLRGI